MLLGLILATLIFAWAFVGLVGLDLLPKNIGQHFDDRRIRPWFDEPWKIVAYGLLAVSLATVGLLYLTGRVGWLPIAGGLGAFIIGIAGMYAPKDTRIPVVHDLDGLRQRILMRHPQTCSMARLSKQTKSNS